MTFPEEILEPSAASLPQDKPTLTKRGLLQIAVEEF